MAEHKLEPIERRIEMLRLLQGKKMRTYEIAEHFGVDERTIRNDMDELRLGLDIFGGIEIQIESKHEGNQEHYYKSTIHPVMLALNSSELYALLKLLETSTDKSYIDDVYKHIFNQIYSQTTEYFERLIADKLSNKYTKAKAKNELEEEAYAQSQDYRLIYWAKSGCYLEVSYFDQGGQRVTEEMQLIDKKGDEIIMRDRHDNKHRFHWNDIVIDEARKGYK